MKNETFDSWAILELFGHRKLAGRVTEATLAGGSFLRIDVPGLDGETAATQFYGPSAIYAITPCEESVARRFAQDHQPAPVVRWELPAETPRRDPYLGRSGEGEEQDPCEHGEHDWALDPAGDSRVCNRCDAEEICDEGSWGPP
jgi:hypothetical protein